jgi:uncharacterized protein YqcC (DUF446 family)
LQRSWLKQLRLPTAEALASERRLQTPWILEQWLQWLFDPRMQQILRFVVARRPQPVNSADGRKW